MTNKEKGFNGVEQGTIWYGFNSSPKFFQIIIKSILNHIFPKYCQKKLSKFSLFISHKRHILKTCW